MAMRLLRKEVKPLSKFIIDCSALLLLEQRVSSVVSTPNYKENEMFKSAPDKVFLNCGCGAGGTCSNSCVSGCAERGGCGPYGPR